MISEKDTLRKGKRVLQASSFDDWRRAPCPNYTLNEDAEFPYSEYPRKVGYEYNSVQLPMAISLKWILDFWGEGRIVTDGITTGFVESYNVNHQFQLVSNGPDTGKKIPNRIPTVDYNSVSVEKYVPNDSFETITLMGAPITAETAAEIARIIGGGDPHALVAIYGFKEEYKPIDVLKGKLDAKELVLSAHFKVHPPLNEITVEPVLAFRQMSSVVTDALSYFQREKMYSCSEILCSLQRSSGVQASARKALSLFFNDHSISDSYLIFGLGYELNKTSDGQHAMDKFMNSNIVKIVRSDYTSVKFLANFGSASYLCVNNKVGSGSSSEWAFFGTSKYIDEQPRYKGGDKLSLVPTPSKKYEFQIKSDFGYTSYLCTKGSVNSDYYRWAFFGTPSCLSGSEYKNGQNFRLYPISGGEKFKVQANCGEISRLCVNGSVGSYQWGFFGTPNYIESGHYSSGETFTIEFCN